MSATTRTFAETDRPLLRTAESARDLMTLIQVTVRGPVWYFGLGGMKLVQIGAWRAR